jgi:broad specificity phosphatase PhoE
VSAIVPATGGPDRHGKVMLVRHGRTDTNQHSYAGWEDVPLNPTGIAQARAAADLLTDVPLDAVFASSLTRASDTAAPIAAAHGCPIYRRDDLREVNYGRYQGLPKAGKPFSLRRDHKDVPVPDGESLTDVFTRVQHVVEEIIPHLAKGRTIAVVGHYWSNRMLAAALDGGTVDDALAAPYKPANGSVYELIVRAESPQQVIATRWVSPAP